LQSGQAYTANLSTDLSNTGTNSYRPDRIHNPYDFSFDTASAQSIDPLCGSGKQTLACFFNPSAFRPAPLAPGQLSPHVFGSGCKPLGCDPACRLPAGPGRARPPGVPAEDCSFSLI